MLSSFSRQSGSGTQLIFVRFPGLAFPFQLFFAKKPLLLLLLLLLLLFPLHHSLLLSVSAHPSLSRADLFFCASSLNSPWPFFLSDNRTIRHEVHELGRAPVPGGIENPRARVPDRLLRGTVSRSVPDYEPGGFLSALLKCLITSSLCCQPVLIFEPRCGIFARADGNGSAWRARWPLDLSPSAYNGLFYPELVAWAAVSGLDSQLGTAGAQPQYHGRGSGRR